MKTLTQLILGFNLVPLTRLALGVSFLTAGLGISLVVTTQNASAQTARDVQPLEDFKAGQNERDSFSGSTGINPYQLIHNYRLGVGDVNEFMRGQETKLDDAAEQFRRLQLERLRGQQQVSPDNSSTPAQPEN
ncbi:MAG: hypothetical protein WA919_04140 [Coleofasciculaceae cyanobacterium]